MNNADIAVVNVEFSLDDGFFWVELDNGKSLQCCLEAEISGEYPNQEISFNKEIDMNDSGFDEGICWDVNRWALESGWEMEDILNFLVEHAREAGLEIKG